ncbi:hypothetical protein Hanom_Chr06g00534391 [Helianthus anomalus]
MIMYYEADKEKAMQYQKLISVCFEKDINSGHYWKTNWSDLEREEFLRKERHDVLINKRMKQSAFKASLKFHNYKSIHTDQEKKKIRLTKFFDYTDVGREWWLTKGICEYRAQRVEQEEKRRRKRRYSRRA